MPEELDLSHFNQGHPSLVFVGDQSAFSDLYLRLIQDQLPDYTIVSDTRISDAEHRIARLRDEAPMIVISCKFGAAVLPVIERFSKAAPSAIFVLAYDRLEDVRAVLETIEELPQLKKLSFLPMRSKIETSIFVLNLRYSGERHFSGELLDLMLERCRAVVGGSASNHVKGGFKNKADCPLTSREREVMEHLCHGAPNKGIACALGLSESTIKLHIHNIIEKLGVHNRTEAAVLYLTSRVQGTETNEP